jgi:hypothetical protein
LPLPRKIAKGFANAIIMPLPTIPSTKNNIIAALKISLAPRPRLDDIITDIATGRPVVATVEKSA